MSRSIRLRRHPGTVRSSLLRRLRLVAPRESLRGFINEDTSDGIDCICKGLMMSGECVMSHKSSG